MRHPSTFSSYTQPSWWKGSRTCVGAIGVYEANTGALIVPCPTWDHRGVRVQASIVAQLTAMVEHALLDDLARPPQY
jgi:hypothetical protein